VEEALARSVRGDDPLRDSHDPARDSHDPARDSHPASSPLPLIGRLPAFYRENPEVLEPLVDAAEEMIADLRTALSRAEARLEREIPAAWDRILDRPDLLGCEASSRDAGTAGGLARWLRIRFGAAPVLWAALEARPHAAGGVVFRSTSWPSAVVAWEKTAFPEAPGEIAIPGELLPAGVPVRAVVLARMPQGRRPRSGERVPGEIVWSRPGIAGECPAPPAGETPRREAR
jgi:hypothetical protein